MDGATHKDRGGVRRLILIPTLFLIVISLVSLTWISASGNEWASSSNLITYQSPDNINSYSLSYSTYFGGSNYEHARDIFVDGQGNLYVTGGTKSTDFPTTIGPVFNNGNCTSLGSEGRMDIFVAKFNPQGNLIWSRLLGGPCYDRAYAIEVDSQGSIYIAGRAGSGFPVTQGAFQTTFLGTDAGIYGWQNAFVAKLSNDGASLLWASYVGVGHMARDLALDSSNNVYLPLGYPGIGATPPAAWFINSYQPTLKGGRESGAIKVTGDGSQVVWATWFGGSGDDTQEASIRVSSSGGDVFFAFSTLSSDLPTTAGAYDRTYNGGQDFFVAHLSSDGSRLVSGTYFGGSGDEWLSTHNLALGPGSSIYFSTWTNSTNYPTTPNALQRVYGGGQSDMGITKLSFNGGLLYSTYLGGSGIENPDGMYTDSAGNLFIVGDSGSTNFPVSVDAYQRTNRGGTEVVLTILSPDFSRLVYSTFMGGSNNEDGRTGFLGQDGNLYSAGQTGGAGWPVLNAYQNTYGGGALDAILTKFTYSYSIPPPPTPIPSDWISLYLPMIR